MCWKCQGYEEPPRVTCWDHWDWQAEQNGDQEARVRRIARGVAALAACENGKMEDATAAAMNTAPPGKDKRM
jgi:hypothetical protein